MKCQFETRRHAVSDVKHFGLKDLTSLHAVWTVAPMMLLLWFVMLGPERRHGDRGNQQRSNGQGTDRVCACAEVLPEPRSAGVD